MPTLDAVFVGKIHLPEIGGGPIIPPGQPGQPPGYWGGAPLPTPTPPIYLPVPPSDAHPEHPIFIPVYPAHPIVLPPPPDSNFPPVTIWPPVIWGGPIIPPEQPPGGGSPPGFWGGGPHPMPPIYVPGPLPPQAGSKPEHPIYYPVYPAHPIVLPPPGGEGPPITVPPDLPPAWVAPPTGARGFWGYSPYYKNAVFVPYEGAFRPPGAPGASPGAPHVDPRQPRAPAA